MSHIFWNLPGQVRFVDPTPQTRLLNEDSDSTNSKISQDSDTTADSTDFAASFQLLKILQNRDQYRVLLSRPGSAAKSLLNLLHHVCGLRCVSAYLRSDFSS